MVTLLLLVSLAFAHPVYAQKFFPDDPLVEEPEPFPTVAPESRDLSEILELLGNVFGAPGEAHPEFGVIPAQGVNTLGEVLDGPWYVNRHGRTRMTREELVRGAGRYRPPSRTGKWEVLKVKPYGLRPGMIIADADRQLYVLRFDPRRNLELATGAAMVASRAFHALGYFVDESYIVYFHRERLVAAEGGEEVTNLGIKRELFEDDIDHYLERVARDPERGYRAVAIRVSDEWEGYLGPYQVYGTRSDDPNDIVPHEHRRDLRGLFVYSAWLNFAYMRAVNTVDALIVENGIPFIRHYLHDLSTTLGSRDNRPKEVWEGSESIYVPRRALMNIISMGIYTPGWMRARYPSIPGVGSFDYETFEPERWTPVQDMAPFENRLPDDEFWAAKNVMAFTDDDIAALVSAGQYTNSRAEEWIVRCLIERRNRIGRTYLSRVLPLDNFRLESRELRFIDLEVAYGYVTSREYTVQWSLFDNELERHTLVDAPTNSFLIPNEIADLDEGAYVAGRIVAEDPEEAVTVYLRREVSGLRVVGIDRNWSDKRLADKREPVGSGPSRYIDLEPSQVALFEPYAHDFNERSGRALSPQEYFDWLTISERTTFDAVTHALMGSRLSDEQGNSLGTAIDLVAGIERIAGQYFSRSGDLQFRLFVDLEPGAVATLDRSREFRRDRDNTVYHVGYPQNFRQSGRYPSIQFSISEDGSAADIDVDYQSSKMPQALWNGHLTSANSDVRARDHHRRHLSRWEGLIAWWRELFGSLPGKDDDENAYLVAEAQEELATPLPRNRTRGTRFDRIDEATQEFLTDWLVRRNVEEALNFVSDQAIACVNLDEDVEDEVLRGARARAALRDVMEGINGELADPDNLTEAIDTLNPWDVSQRVVEHPFEGDFSLIEMTRRDAAIYVCDVPKGVDLTSDTYGDYYSALFRFKLPGERGGVFGLLWAREDGTWRVVSFAAFEQ
jgi:hypothetical protein